MSSAVTKEPGLGGTPRRRIISGSLPVFPHQTKVSFLFLLAALAWHVGIATKSLARDLGIGKRTRDVMRAAYALTVFALIALVVLAS